MINTTDDRKRGWYYPARRNMVTHMQRLRSLSLIVAVSSKGDFMYTVNSGKNNGQTFILFLIKLCEHLDSEDPQWRENIVLLLDNAPYHRSKVVMEKLEKLKLPILFLGPY